MNYERIFSTNLVEKLNTYEISIIKKYLGSSLAEFLINDNTHKFQNFDNYSLIDLFTKRLE